MQVPAHSNNTLGATLLKFMNGSRGYEKGLFIDDVDWPNNAPCSNGVNVFS